MDLESRVANLENSMRQVDINFRSVEEDNEVVKELSKVLEKHAIDMMYRKSTCNGEMLAKACLEYLLNRMPMHDSRMVKEADCDYCKALKDVRKKLFGKSS